jgi:ATP-dependent DNA helicase RecG
LHSADQIGKLLQKLDERQADDLEDQWLDFKQWNERSMSDSVDMVVEMAVCMANGGRGTVVFGVKDWATGREDAILGVPPEVDVNRLRRSVYDKTDPHLTPDFEEIRVPEGTRRLIVMRVIGGAWAIHGYSGWSQDPDRQRLYASHRQPAQQDHGGDRGE